MINFTIEIADEVIFVEALYETTKEFCRDYLSDRKSDFFIKMTIKDIFDEQIKSDIHRKNEGLSPKKYSKNYLETLALYRKILEKLLYKNIILLHGSTVAVDGYAYLFTAPSGTGKSTHVRLWIENFKNRAVIVNDDKPLIKLGENEIKVYGTPWMGKHNLGNNVSFPLKAICFLERAEENNIENVCFSKVYATLLQQIQKFEKADDMLKLLSLVELFRERVSFYRLYCNISKEAANVSYNFMKGD